MLHAIRTDSRSRDRVDKAAACGQALIYRCNVYARRTSDGKCTFGAWAGPQALIARIVCRGGVRTAILAVVGRHSIQYPPGYRLQQNRASHVMRRTCRLGGGDIWSRCCTEQLRRVERRYSGVRYAAPPMGGLLLCFGGTVLRAVLVSSRCWPWSCVFHAVFEDSRYCSMATAAP
jgi:hypothetical protein